MARTIDHKQALELRGQGLTYSEIREKLGISKSTLSDWLKNKPLTEDQLKRVRNKKSIQIEHYRKSCQVRRERIAKIIYESEKESWLPLTEREVLLAGLFLYWGEGTKVSTSTISVSNCDPRVIKFAIYWMINGLKIDKSELKILIHLYSDMDIEKEFKYWEHETGIPRTQFKKPYIKQSTRAGLSYKSFGHGTCNVITFDVNLKSKIMQAISAISDYYSDLI